MDEIAFWHLLRSDYFPIPVLVSSTTPQTPYRRWTSACWSSNSTLSSFPILWRSRASICWYCYCAITIHLICSAHRTCHPVSLLIDCDRDSIDSVSADSPVLSDPIRKSRSSPNWFHASSDGWRTCRVQWFSLDYWRARCSWEVSSFQTRSCATRVCVRIQYLSCVNISAIEGYRLEWSSNYRWPTQKTSSAAVGFASWRPTIGGLFEKSLDL